MQEPKSETYFLRFSECIKKLEREIPDEHLGPLYSWIDAIYDGAWSKAIDRLERAVLKAQRNLITDHDFRYEQSIYFDSMIEFVREYKKHKQIDETDTFLKSLGTQ